MDAFSGASSIAVYQRDTVDTSSHGQVMNNSCIGDSIYQLVAFIILAHVQKFPGGRAKKQNIKKHSILEC